MEEFIFFLLSLLFGSEVYIHYRLGKLESEVKWIKTILLNIINNNEGENSCLK